MNVEENSEEFGARVADQLLNARANRGGPRAMAKGMVAAIMLKHPEVKLPEILALEDVSVWMKQNEVTENLLRTALTEARQAFREQPVEPVVKKPRSRRIHALAEPAGNRSVARAPTTHKPATLPQQPARASLFDEGMVPNRPVARPN